MGVRLARRATPEAPEPFGGALAPVVPDHVGIGDLHARAALVAVAGEQRAGRPPPAPAQGIGGPHEGLRMIWPMAIILYAFTSDDDAQIRQCLQWLKTTDNGTGFMHEAFDQDDPSHFTRAWFAWANTLFGELIVHLHQTRPQLLRA